MAVGDSRVVRAWASQGDSRRSRDPLCRCYALAAVPGTGRGGEATPCRAPRHPRLHGQSGVARRAAAGFAASPPTCPAPPRPCVARIRFAEAKPALRFAKPSLPANMPRRGEAHITPTLPVLCKINYNKRSLKFKENRLTPQVGFEPTTTRLTVERSTTELLRIFLIVTYCKFSDIVVLFFESDKTSSSVTSSEFTKGPHGSG